MSYDSNVNQAAKAELEQRRKLAEETARRNLEGFLQGCPRAGEIRRELAANAAGTARAVLSGGDVHKALEQRKERGLALRKEYEELLGECGLTRRDIEPQYTCPRCKDTGFADGKLCSCYKALRRNLAYRDMSVELPLGQCTFDGFSLEYYRNDPAAYGRMQSILRSCREYAENFRANSPNLLFWGGTGLGKTHLSLAIANAALDKGFGVVYGSAQRFAVALERERFGRDNSIEGTSVNLKECDLLILDDLGTEFSSAYSNAAIYDVVNARLMSGRPTVISTNLGLPGLEERYGERFTSRIAGNYALLGFMGKDVRVQKIQS